MAARLDSFALAELAARPEDAFRLAELAMAEGSRIPGYGGDHYYYRIGDAAAVIRTRLDPETGEEELLPVAGAFVAIGLVPDNAAFAGQLDMDEAGYRGAGEDCRTSLPGVFAAGDTRTK